MNIKETFLNKSIESELGQINQEEVDLMRNIDQVKKVITGDNKIAIVVHQNTIDEICKWYKIDTNLSEHRNLVKEIIEKSHYLPKHNYPVIFTNNLLYIEHKSVESFLQKDNDKEVLRELTQLLTLLKIHKVEPLQNISKIKNLPFASIIDLNEFLKYEKQIEEKIKKSLNFVELVEHLSALPPELKFNENGEKIAKKVVYELEKILINKPEEQNLIEEYKKHIFFNEYSLDCYVNLELNENRKRESIQALYLILSGQTDEHNIFSKNLTEKKDTLINYLKRQVTKPDILSALDKLPSQRGQFTKEQLEEFCSILKLEDRNKFIIFEEGIYNVGNFNNFLQDNFKQEQIVLYFMILCVKENPDFNCKLIDNKVIDFSVFEQYFYLEDILKKRLSDYSLNDILKSVHDFQKDKIFTKQNEKIMDSIISENLVNKYAFNTINQEVLFINSTRCVFNEKLISKIESLKESELLELFMMTQEKFVEDLANNIKLDKSVLNIKKYKEEIQDLLKYKITEQNILESIDSIQQKSNTLIESKNEIFKQVSILLNAKEVKEIKNDVVKSSFREDELYLYSFNEEICDKLLKKELSEVGKREFCQTLLLWEIKNKNIPLKNQQDNIVRIHDNFNVVEKYIDSIVDKIYFQVSEEEIDKSLSVITNRINSESIEAIKHSINNIKKKCGIKTKSAFKHIL